MLQSDQSLIAKSNNADDYEGKKVKIKAKYYAKIIGGHEKVFKLFCNKFKYQDQNVNMNKIILFDSFDRINHLETAEGKVDLISFNTTLVNKNLLNNFYYSTMKSSSILVWMQITAKEELAVLILALE